MNIEESFLSLDDEPRFDAYAEEWWLQLREYCLGLELGPGMRVACDLEDESGKLNVNLTRTTRVAPRQTEEEKPTRDAFARDALRRLFEAQNVEVDIVDQLREYWLQDPPQDPADQRGRLATVPEFRSLEDFAAQFRIPADRLHALRRVLTAQPVVYMRAMNVNTAHPQALAALFNDPEIVSAIMERQQGDEPFQSAGEVRTLLNEYSFEHADVVAGLFDVRSRLFRLRASAVTNIDPEGEPSGGIGQTVSALVLRQVDPRRRPVQGEGPGWTFRLLDWQKEGGARLLTLPGAGEEDEGLADDYASEDRF
jgi:type II secretory pathway component PulK